MSTVSIDAPAKLTVHLHVTGVRDDGMHLIDAEMVSLDFHDTLHIGDGDSLTIKGDSGVPTDERNLIMRALRLANKRAQIELVKRIPMGGGLGGGSSDAGAVLRWAKFDNLEAASRIGADVPFCIAGGRARVRGIGERIEPLPFEPRMYTLLLPPFGVNTAAVYRAFDESPSKPDLSVRNHLEKAAIAVEPRLALVRDRFADLTGATPILAGSGSTWFVEGSHEKPSGSELRGDRGAPLAGFRWIPASTIPAASV